MKHDSGTSLIADAGKLHLVRYSEIEILPKTFNRIGTLRVYIKYAGTPGQQIDCPALH